MTRAGGGRTLAGLVRTRLVFGFALVLGCGASTGIPVPVVRDAAMPIDTSVHDANVIDAFRPDAGVDAAPDCRVDADCDDRVPCTHDTCTPRGTCMHTTDDALCNDGRFCNGIETCSLGGCVPGQTPCIDAVDCTDDSCIEATDSCVHTPDDARCPLSNTCDVLLGCEPRLLAQDPTSIYNIALPSGVVSLITRTDTPLTDIALAEDGTFYGATAGRGLRRLDPRTGATTLVAPVAGRFYGLEADPASRALFGASDDRIMRFDLVTGALTQVGLLPAGEIVSGDLAFIGGRLLITATRNFRVADDDLFSIDLAASGSPRLIGSTGHPCIFGMAVYRDTLYGLTCDGLVLQIDPTTAASTIVSRTMIEFDGGAAR